jgi:hypothetical protein
LSLQRIGADLYPFAVLSLPLGSIVSSKTSAPHRKDKLLTALVESDCDLLAAFELSYSRSMPHKIREICLQTAISRSFNVAVGKSCKWASAEIARTLGKPFAV